MAFNSTFKLNKSTFSNNDRINKFSDKLNVNKLQYIIYFSIKNKKIKIT